MSQHDLAPPRRCEACTAAMRPWRLGRSLLLRCEACGHLVRALADAPAHHRDHAYGGEPHLDAARLALTHRALVADGRPASVFEVGYGTGALLRRFLDAGAAVAGADPDQLELAVDERVKAAGQLFPTAVENVDPDAVRVDMVFGIHVLEHVLDPALTLRTSARILEPGGSIHFFTPAGDWAALSAARDGWWMLEDPTHVRFFTADSLAHLAHAAGFVDVEVRRPMLDSLVNDAASAIRRVRPRARPAGVLAQRSTMVLAAAGLPLTLAARAANPRLRPTLHLVAKVPG